jgi:hypothetical protein
MQFQENPGLRTSLRLQGEFVTKHRTQLRQIAETAARTLALSEPNARIVQMTDIGDEIRIEANSASLVRRIAERVCAVCGGSVMNDADTNGHHPALLWSR